MKFIDGEGPPFSNFHADNSKEIMMENMVNV